MARKLFGDGSAVVEDPNLVFEGCDSNRVSKVDRSIFNRRAVLESTRDALFGVFQQEKRNFLLSLTVQIKMLDIELLIEKILVLLFLSLLFLFFLILTT